MLLTVLNNWICMLVYFLKYTMHLYLISCVFCCSLVSLHERLLKMEKQFKIQTRWSPSDPQYRSSLVTCEAVRAKQTLDLILVSGRRRWFLLSLKKKYTGIFFVKLKNVN